MLRLSVKSCVLALALCTSVFPVSRGHAAGYSTLLPGWLTGEEETQKAHFATAKATALADKDAWHAWELLSSRVPDDLSDEVREQYRQFGTSLVLQAAKQNNPEALELVFERDDVSEFTDARPTLAATLIRLAGQSSGARSDRTLLEMAGDVLQEGKWTVRNSLRAAAFYAMAWRAGSNDAPSRLFSLYSELNDPGSAYLWKLRCTGSCYIAGDLNKPDLFLNTRQIQWIQKQAADNSILTINGLVARKELQ
ncbi:hypothetical protein ACI2I2_19980 [Scandinavium sp. NPDC088450]|uniref:hypothetical protein n=1 Tax=Scandinavium sp. NPDC088450 TaxID=3364514 RepID=UPI00384B9DF7